MEARQLVSDLFLRALRADRHNAPKTPPVPAPMRGARLVAALAEPGRHTTLIIRLAKG